jgi:hypothetical protein
MFIYVASVFIGIVFILILFSPFAVCMLSDLPVDLIALRFIGNIIFTAAFAFADPTTTL